METTSQQININGEQLQKAAEAIRKLGKAAEEGQIPLSHFSKCYVIRIAVLRRFNSFALRISTYWRRTIKGLRRALK